MPEILPGQSTTIVAEFDGLPALGVAVGRVELTPAGDNSTEIESASSQSMTLAIPIVVLLGLIAFLFGWLALRAFARHRRADADIPPMIEAPQSRRTRARASNDVNLRCIRSTPLMVALIGLLAGLAVAVPAAAQSVTDGPTVVPDVTDLQIGQRVRMTITGFDAPVVIMAVCGNEARRGSVDCDNLGSQARENNLDGTPTIGSVVVGAPPAPCPVHHPRDE